MSDLNQSTDSAAIGSSVYAHSGRATFDASRSAGKGEGSGDADDVRKKLLKEKQALTQVGMPTITNRAQLKSAISQMMQTERSKIDPKVAKYVTARAYALGMSDLLSSSPMRAEGKTLTSVLTLEGVAAPAIVQEATPENGGRMRIRVPFYVGNSIARAPGFDKRIYFNSSLLPGIIQEAKAQIKEGKQPLNVYARHSHAMSGDHLPIGAVVDVEQEGRVGYSTIELEPIVPDGVNAQILIRGKKLNAVSLRSREGQFELEEKKVNGEIMLEPTRMAICGVDFAPDSPAQPTYGIEVLAAEARVEETGSPSRKTKARRSNLESEITLEMLKSEHSEIVAEVEKPLRKQIDALTQEVSTLKAQNWQIEKAKLIDDFAGRFGDNAAKAKELLTAECKDAKAPAEVKAAIADVFLLIQEKAAAQKSKAESLAELWPTKPAGSGDQTLTSESASGPVVQAEMASGLPVPA